MKIFVRYFAVSACALVLSAASSAQAAPKDYQVTGPILSMTDTTIVVQKGKEQWEIGRDASTKGADALKVGDKVTVHYTMTAVSVEAKPAKAAAGSGKKKGDATAAPASGPAAADAKPKA